jgi:PEP-CTERM motif
MIKSMIGALGVVSLFAVPATAAVTVTFENATVQNSTAGFDFVGIETFEGTSTGSGKTLITTFGGSEISGTYTNLRVDGPNRFGSAGGVGNHAVAPGGTAGYELTLTTARPEGITYFGYWLSALDRGNILEFYSGATKIHTFTPDNVIDRIGGCPLPPADANPYCGNPTTAFLNQNAREPYAFVNIYFTGNQTFDRVKFYESPNVGNYESDNHTVGYFTEITGNGVPEPASWALLIAGFGLTGAAMRRRRVSAFTA